MKIIENSLIATMYRRCLDGSRTLKLFKVDGELEEDFTVLKKRAGGSVLFGLLLDGYRKIRNGAAQAVRFCARKQHGP